MAKDNKMLSQFIEKAEHIPEILLKAGVAYAGYKVSKHWMGALAGLVALKLATAPNLPAGVAGTVALAGLGIASTIDAPATIPALLDQQPLEGAAAAAAGEGTNSIKTQAECREAGGTIISILPPTNLCLCNVPDPIPADPWEPVEPKAITR